MRRRVGSTYNSLGDGCPDSCGAWTCTVVYWYQTCSGVRQIHPVPVLEIDNAASIDHSNYMGCAALTDGTVKCWAGGTYQTVGDGSSGITRYTPVYALIDHEFFITDVRVAASHACALSGAGGVLCWGNSQ